MDTKKEKCVSGELEARKAYASPVLICYGAVKDLTTGGSIGIGDSSASPMTEKPFGN